MTGIYTWYITGIYTSCVYTWEVYTLHVYIPGIYQVYTMKINTVGIPDVAAESVQTDLFKERRGKLATLPKSTQAIVVQD